MDMNGNGFLSLAEVDKGIRDVLQCEELFDCKPAVFYHTIKCKLNIPFQIKKAFDAAKNAVKSKN